jgi:hypothetical protein
LLLGCMRRASECLQFMLQIWRGQKFQNSSK